MPEPERRAKAIPARRRAGAPRTGLALAALAALAAAVASCGGAASAPSRTPGATLQSPSAAAATAGPASPSATPAASPTPAPVSAAPTAAPTTAATSTAVPAALAITSHRSGDTVATSRVTVSGTGPPGATIVRDVSLAPDDHVAVGPDGRWAIEVSLSAGSNTLRFRVGDDKSTEQDLVLVYSPPAPTPEPAASKPDPTPDLTPEPTPFSLTIRRTGPAGPEKVVLPAAGSSRSRSTCGRRRTTWAGAAG